jgi:hypothetical protein
MQYYRNIALNFDTKYWSLFLLTVVLLVLILFSLFKATDRTPPERAWALPAFDSCEKEVRAEIHPEKVDLELLSAVMSLCLTTKNKEDASAFEVNRSFYYEQNFEDRVIMWMVVAITMSGVVLAGLQLLASYNLALSGKGMLADGNEISIENSRLSVKSAVTGLMVLVISLAFFIIYVRDVYKIKPARIEPAVTRPTEMATEMARTPFAGVQSGGQLPQPSTRIPAGQPKETDQSFAPSLGSK